MSDTWECARGHGWWPEGEQCGTCEESALAARVIDAAMAWHCVAEPTETSGLKSYTIDAWNDRHQAFRDACDALAAFRARKGNAE